MENPIKIDDLGIPLFLETSIYSKIHQIKHPKNLQKKPSSLDEAFGKPHFPEKNRGLYIVQVVLDEQVMFTQGNAPQKCSEFIEFYGNFNPEWDVFYTRKLGGS